MDILASTLGLVCLSPFFALIAILIRLDSPGPVFYRGPRLGKGGKTFSMLKFRSMYERPESYEGPPVTGQDDQRITPLGQFLRNAKINELPQLWNVLKGEMSLVGPRPEDPKLAEEWPEDVRNELLSVRPGVTSPASVVYHDEEKKLPLGGDSLMAAYLEEILPSKLRLDQLYIRNRSILTDLDVIFWTAVIMLPRLREREIPNYMLYAGPLWQFASRVLSRFTIDFMVAVASVGVAWGIWRLDGPMYLGLVTDFSLALASALLFSLINAALGLNRVSWEKAPPNRVIELAFSTGLTTLIIVVVLPQFHLKHPIPPGLIILSGMLALFGFILARYRERLLTGAASRWLGARRGASELGERVLIVGAGNLGQLVSWMLQRSEFVHSFSIVGMVDDDPRKRDMEVDTCKVLGSSADLPGLVEKYNVGVIIFAINEIGDEERERILSVCRQTRARLALFPDLVEVIKSHLSNGNERQTDTNNKNYDAGGLIARLDELDALLAEGDLVTARVLVHGMKKNYSGESRSSA
jgi:lipopolysaccharide/colanic/teichoic acid biosynthesis glycosyltransferase